MKILLVGEFSGFHNNLKEGLSSLGHHVVLASAGDSYKNFPTDISFRSDKKNKLINNLNLMGLYAKALPKLTGYDVVQFIHPNIFAQSFGINKRLINYLIKKNKRSFLIAAGDDGVVWDYWQNKAAEPMRYSWIPYQKMDDLANGRQFSVWDDVFTLNYNRYLAQKVNGIIPVMYEYDVPYQQFKNKKAVIPIPINLQKITYEPNTIEDKLVVFHGLNRYNAKGTPFIEKAFAILNNKYPDKIECIIKGKLPYDEYLQLMKRVNVIIDQVHSYSLGVSGLLGLAMGKIVLGGNEPEAQETLGYENCPVVNIEPDVIKIVQAVELVLNKKDEIPEISKQGRGFMEQNHDHVKIAKRYLETWSQ